MSGAFAGYSALWQFAVGAEQIRVHDLARNRRRRTVAAVLDEHRERNARRLGGREGDEPRMIAVALCGLLLVVFLVLPDIDDLRRTGFARDDVRGARGARPRRAVGRSAHHAVDDAHPISVTHALDRFAGNGRKRAHRALISRIAVTRRGM